MKRDAHAMRTRCTRNAHTAHTISHNGTSHIFHSSTVKGLPKSLSFYLSLYKIIMQVNIDLKERFPFFKFLSFQLNHSCQINIIVFILAMRPGQLIQLSDNIYLLNVSCCKLMYMSLRLSEILQGILLHLKTILSSLIPFLHKI